jgi:hypothetical protein
MLGCSDCPSEVRCEEQIRRAWQGLYDVIDLKPWKRVFRSGLMNCWNYNPRQTLLSRQVWGRCLT